MPTSIGERGDGVESASNFFEAFEAVVQLETMRAARDRICLPPVESDRNLATWLVTHRREIENAMKVQLGAAAPSAGSAESEALRRFRSFLSGALVRGESSPPALDGLRLNERRVMALIDAWTEAAAAIAGDLRPDLRGIILPWTMQFRLALRTSGPGRRQRGRPRASRRAVVAAIDRVADAFLAIDTDTGEIVDANPAAGSLLGVNRDALLGVDATNFVPRNSQDGWWTELDAMTEDGDTRSFWAHLVDASGGPVDVHATMTRFASKGRVLALLMVRPQALAPPPGSYTAAVSAG
jgi:PAS domain-containing protein